MLMDAVVTDPAGDVDTRDSGLGEPVAELGDGGEGDDDELKLETSTPNGNPGGKCLA
jgi:hypothetical protein